MRFIAGGDWKPLPGTLIDWVPSEATQIASQQAPPHPTPPSFLQRDHINAVLAQRAEGRVHRGYTCSALRVDGDLDTDQMTAAITDFLRAHEGLRSSFRVVDSQVVRYVVAADAIEMEPHEVGAATPSEHLDHRLPVDAVFDAFPGCAFGVVTRPGSFDLYYGVDHAFGDGSSQVLGLLELLARYRNEQSHPLVAATPASHLDYIADEYGRAGSVSGESPSVLRWREVLAAAGGTIPPFPLPLGADDAPQPVTIHTEELVDAPTTERLAELASTHDTSLVSVVYSGLAIAQRALNGDDWYATATVLSTRGSGAHRTSQGWYCNFAPIGFPVVGDELSEVINASAAAVAASKAAAQDPVHACLAVLIGEGTLDPSAAQSPQMVNYLDFRWFPTPAGAHDLVVFTGEGRTRNASLWISRDIDGLRIATQRPDNPVAAESVSRFFTAVRQALTAGVPATSGVN